MSGNSKGQTAPTTSEAITGVPPAYLQGTRPTTQPAGMSGQIGAIAQQLAAGFGGTPAAFMAHLNQAYQPAKTLDFAPAKVNPKVVAAPKVGPKAGPKADPKKPADKWVYSGGRNMR